MASDIAELNYAAEASCKRRKKLEQQLKEANKIIYAWGKHVDKYGCNSDEMDKLFKLGADYIKAYKYKRSY